MNKLIKISLMFSDIICSQKLNDLFAFDETSFISEKVKSTSRKDGSKKKSLQWMIKLIIIEINFNFKDKF